MSGFMEYANATHSNIIPKEEFENLTLEVFNTIASNLGLSLGPLGSSATILDGMMTEATKDGYSILKKYRFHNRYKRMIYNLIVAPCTRLNNTVGDATTTVICLTNALFARYQAQKDALNTLYRLPRHLVKAWDEVVHDLCEEVAKSAAQIDPKDYDTIYNIAYVVSNGNEDISRAIAKTYTETNCPNIKRKDSPTNKSYIVPVSGFDFPAWLIADVFALNDNRSIKENDVAVILMDHKLEPEVFDKVIVPINDCMRAQSRKLLVMAPYYDKVMVDNMVGQYLNMEMHRYGAFNLILSQYTLGDLAPHQLTDLGIILRGKVLDQEKMNQLRDAIESGDVDTVVENILTNDEDKYYHYIGSVKEAMLSTKPGAIFNADKIEEDQDYQVALVNARDELDRVKAETPEERQSYAHKVYEANARIQQLEMKNYIYYVGADSALQKQITEDAIDDVIKCLRSAIKSGVVPGCQLTLLRGCQVMMERLTGVEYPIVNSDQAKETLDKMSEFDRLKLEILNIIYAALSDVYKMILHGADGLGMIKLQPRWQFTTEEGAEALKDEAKKHATRIVIESVNKMQVFDIENLEYSDKIITSAETDSMVLRAATELVKILISGNQCVVLDSDVDESHQEEVQAYV